MSGSYRVKQSRQGKGKAIDGLQDIGEDRELDVVVGVHIPMPRSKIQEVREVVKQNRGREGERGEREGGRERKRQRAKASEV